MELKEKNIDNLFKKGLAEHEVAPSEEVWASISDQLQKKKSKKLVVFWYRIAAGMAILLTSSWLIMKTINKGDTISPLVEIQEQVNNNQNDATINKNENLKPDENVSSNSIKSLEPDKKLAKENPPVNNNDKLADGNTQNAPSKQKSLFTIKNQEHQFIVKKEETSTEEDSFNKLAMLNILLDEKIPQDNIQYEPYEFPRKEVAPEKNINKWEVGGYYAPLYSYRALEHNKGDLMYSNNLVSNAEQGQYTYSGGISVNYKINNRLSIGTGLSVVNHSYEISNVAALSSYNNLSYFGMANERTVEKNQVYSVNNSIGEISTSGEFKSYSKSTEELAFWTASDNQAAVYNSFALPDNQVINQSFDYVEVPILMRYKILNKSLGLHLVSGISSYFLVNNKVTIESPNQPDINGKTINVRSTNISGSLGLGVNYALGKSLFFNMEPLFKIFLNSINTSSSIDAYPYSFGIYSGVSYSF